MDILILQAKWPDATGWWRVNINFGDDAAALGWGKVIGNSGHQYCMGRRADYNKFITVPNWTLRALFYTAITL